MPRVLVLVVSLLGLAPVSGHAGEEGLTQSPIRNALGYLRAETPKRAGDLLRDNLNLWQPSLGLGAQVEVAKNVALRIDLDRYRPRFPGAIGRDNIDSVTLYLSFDSL